MQAVQRLPKMRKDGVWRAMHRRTRQVQMAQNQRRCNLRGQAGHLPEKSMRVRPRLREKDARATCAFQLRLSSLLVDHWMGPAR